MRIDGNGIKYDLTITASHVERIEKILDADVMSSKRGRVVARKLRRCASHRTNTVAIGCGINEKYPLGGFERF